MKISLSIATLVLALASAVTSAPATVPGRAPFSNSTTTAEGDDVPPAPQEIVKILKQMGWLSSNYKSPESKSSNPSSSPSSHNGVTANNGTHTFQKRANCNPLDLIWFRRHPGRASPEDQDMWAKNAFTVLVSPNKYKDKMPPADTEGVAPEYWEDRVSKDRKWIVGHDRHYMDGKVALSANGQTKWMDVRNFDQYKDEEDGYVIFTNKMWECMVWF